MNRLIYLIAGEASGDVLGARLMAALRAVNPGIRFAGVGGPRMAEKGLASLFPMSDLALMGFLEVVPKLRLLRARLRQTVSDALAREPAAVVTIDSPGFTLRVLRRLGGAPAKRIHYVAPQVWAWREGRVRHYPGLWDRLMCLLPFEPAFFARHGLPASFVGHPVLESGAGKGDAARFRAVHGLTAEARILTIMPGSRAGEVSRLMPVLGETLRRLPPLVPAVPVASSVADAVRQGAAGWPMPPILVEGEQAKHDAFAASAAALTKSGTSTLELALANVPMVVAYRVNPLSAAIARRLVTVRHAALVNLLAAPPPSTSLSQGDGEVVVPELIQQDCTPDRLAAALGPLLTDPARAEAQRAGFFRIINALQPESGLLPSEAAAQEVLAAIEQA